MKRKKGDATSAPEAPAESILVLRKRTVASLSDDQLSGVAGGHPHTCEPTCPHTCCGPTCGDTCGDTCRGSDCYDTCYGPSCGETCPVEECTVP